MPHTRKSIPFKLIVLLSFLSILNITQTAPSLILAATPWTQTDWSGGAGQASWSDETKYSTGSDVNSSTSGQISLAANSQHQTHWGEGFKYRKTLTFDNFAQAENLANFPVLVKLTSSNFDFSKSQTSGQDIRFVDSDDSTALPYEIEKWDAAGQEADIWVKVPQIDTSSSTDFIYMYYGNPTATDGQDAENVWDSGYMGVWHFKETSGQQFDSTSNSYDSTSVNVTQQGANIGKIGPANEYNNSQVGLGTFPQIGANTTVSLWVNPQDESYQWPYRALISMGRDSPLSGWTLWLNDTGKLVVGTRVDGTNWWVGDYVTNIPLNDWSHIVFVFDEDGVYLYLNGQILTYWAFNFGQINYLYSETLYIGRFATHTSYGFKGYIDELQISDDARSASWIAAQYASMNNSFVTYGDETQSTWWGSTWKYREKITFDNSAQAENLVNFPVLVKLNSSRVNYALTKDSGEDIRFIDADGTTLPYEIEKWDETGDSFVWVKVPQIDASSATDYVYMYFGNSAASDSQTPTSVWDSSYVSVHHLGETTGDHQDSTTNNIDSTTKVVSVQGSASGKIDGADEFISGNYVDLGGFTSYSSVLCGTQMTWSTWFNSTSTSNGMPMSYIPTGFSGEGSFYIILDTNGILSSNASSRYGPSVTVTSPTGGYNDGNWHYVSFTFDTSSRVMKLYADGLLANQDTISSWVNPLTCSWPAYYWSKLSLGIQHYAYGNYYSFIGKIDEPRISNAIRSDSWVAADYKSINDTFSSFANIEGAYKNSSTLASSIFDTAQSSNWGNLTWTQRGTGTVAVKVRTSNSAIMEGAIDWGSCIAVSNGSDMSSNNCVTDGQRYAQYQVGLSTTDPNVTPVLEDITLAYDLNTSPTGSMVIASGASYTTTTNVALTLSATDDLDEAASLQMMLSDNSSFTGASWESFVPLKIFTLSTGDGTKTVYVKFKDTAGNISEVYSDTIVYDSNPPSDEISINTNATYTKTRDITLTINAADALSGVYQMMVSEDSTFVGAVWETYATTKAWTLSSGDGTKTIYIKFKDLAGNISSIFHDSIILDTTQPAIVLLKLNGTDFTSDITTWEVTSTKPPFSGTTEPGATVIITVSGTPSVIGTVTAGADGTWSWTPTTDLSLGAHTVTITSADLAGNTKSLNFTLEVKGVTATTLPNTGIPLTIILLTILFLTVSGLGTKFICKLQQLLFRMKGN